LAFQLDPGGLKQMAPLLVLVIIAVVLLAMMIKIIPEHERALVYRLGRRLGPPVGPGLILIIPVIDKVIRIGTNTVVLDITPIELFTADGKQVMVSCEVMLDKDRPGPEAPENLARYFQEQARQQLVRLTLADLQARVGTHDPGLVDSVSSRVGAVGEQKAKLIIKEVIPK
jgi:regulator of protease activity HflC (stomatin/prohibitin superfamily)